MHESNPESGLKEVCPVEGCTGDARYFPPGRGHKEDCPYPYESPEVMDKIKAAFNVTGEPVALEAQPSTESKIIIAMLMRIYDVQMAMLSHLNKPMADKIYDAHEAGKDFNPTIYIPEIDDV